MEKFKVEITSDIGTANPTVIETVIFDTVYKGVSFAQGLIDLWEQDTPDDCGKFVEHEDGVTTLYDSDEEEYYTIAFIVINEGDEDHSLEVTEDVPVYEYVYLELRPVVVLEEKEEDTE